MSSVPQAAQSRVRILVADDHEVMRLGIRNLVESRSGWSVCADAANGQEAIQKALQFLPDVIIMDNTMPDMNGLEASTEIARLQPQLPIILFSLHLSEDLCRHFPTDAVKGAVAKGDAARDLVQAIENVIEAIAARVRDDLAVLAVDLGIDEDVSAGLVVVTVVVRCVLEMPSDLAVRRIVGDGARRV